MLGIAGEPGIGKSRCSTNSAKPGRAAGDLLRRALSGLWQRHTVSAGPPPAAPALWHRRGGRPGGNHDESPCHTSGRAPARRPAPYLLSVLGVAVDGEPLARLSPKAIRARTFASLQQVCLASSRRQALILAVENLHWIDPTSEEWLTALVERLAGAAILVLVTYRPGYRPAWLAQSYATQLALLHG